MGLSLYIITVSDSFEKSVLLILALGIVGLAVLLVEDIMRIPLHFKLQLSPCHFGLRVPRDQQARTGISNLANVTALIIRRK